MIFKMPLKYNTLFCIIGMYIIFTLIWVFGKSINQITTGLWLEQSLLFGFPPVPPTALGGVKWVPD